MSNDKNPGRFTESNELFNGRLAMLGLALALATELMTGEGILGQLNAIVENFF